MKTQATQRIKELEHLMQEYQYILTASENPAQRVRADWELKKLRAEYEQVKAEIEKTTLDITPS